MMLAFLSIRDLWQVVRRRPLLAAAATILVGVLGVGIGLHVLSLSHYEAARQALDNRDLEEASAKLQLCLRVWPYSSDTLLLAARLERLSGNYVQADNYLNQCKRLHGGITGRVQLEWTLLRAASGGFDEAEAELWHCVDARGPEAPYVLEVLAENYIHKGLYEKASQVMDKWVALEPNNPYPLEMRAQLLEVVAEYDNARKDYQQLVVMAPQHWKGRLRYVEFLLDDNNGEEAKKHLDLFFRDHGDHIDVQVGLARCNFLLEHFEEARTAFDRILEKHPDYWPALYHRARLEFQDDQFAQAEKWVRKALALEPGRLELQFLLLQALKDQPGREADLEAASTRFAQSKKDTDLIHDLISARLKLDANNPEIYCQIGTAYLRLKMDKAGLFWLQKALEKAPRHQETHAVLARYYEEHGQAQLAAQHKQQAQ